MATVGKRTNTSAPLTEHDVAERLDKAAVRLLKLLMEFRQMGMVEEIRQSRYFTNACPALMAELELWGLAAQPLRDLATRTDEARLDLLTHALYEARVQRLVPNSQWERVKTMFPSRVQQCRDAVMGMIESGEI